MSVQDVLRAPGQWSVQLKPDAPAGILSALDYFGHVAIIPGRISPVERGDELLTLARYVGILRTIEGGAQVTLSGVGMAAWLGDEDGKGDVIETPGISLSGVTFAAAVRALLPAGGSITEGTLYSGVTGTYTNVHSYQSPRTAIQYVCDTMGGEWRVNGNGTLDAGLASSLFRTTPTCVVVRRGAGYDVALKALPGDVTSVRTVKDYTSRVVLIAAALAGGTADASTVPYKDIHGNTVKMTRVVDEQDDTLIANAPARAQAVLNLWNNVRRSVTLTVDEFDVAGDFQVGDVVWCYDPDQGVADTGYEVQFRGQTINPMAVRVLSVTWPVEAGYTVGYRSSTGVWTDLTPWVAWESPGGGQLEIADSHATALTPGVGSIGTLVSGGGGGAGDAAVPDVPTFGTFTTTTYQPGSGIAQAAIKVTWTQPLNTDSSTIVDGDHYEIRYRPNGTTDWQTTMVAFDQTSVTIVSLSTSTTYDFQIRAVDYASPINYGAWSSTTSFLSATDTTAPATPAPPTVAASLIAIQVTHTLGLASGGTYNLPLDLDHLEIHGGTTSGFTPSTGTLLGKLAANAGMILAAIPAVGTFDTGSTATVFVKVVAVDKTGNRSTASSAAGQTASLIDDSHISTLTVSKITAGSLSAAVILSGSIKTATSGQRVESDSNGIRLYNSGGSVVVNLDASTGNGTFNGGGTFTGALSAASGTFNGDISGANGTFTGNLSGSTISASTITGSTLKTASSGARVEVGVTSGTQYIDLYGAGGDHAYIKADNNLGSNELALYSASGNYISINGTTVGGANGHGTFACTSTGFAAQSYSGGSISLDSNVSISGGSVTLSGTTTLSSTSYVNGDWHVQNDLYIPGVYSFSSAGAGATVNLETGANHRLYRFTSSRAFKSLITTAPDASIVLGLRPVTFYDKQQLADANGDTALVVQQYGLIAEEVDDAGLGEWLVQHEPDGTPVGVNYDRLGVMLLPIVAGLTERVAALEARAAG